MKKILWILGGLFTVFLVAAISVPLFVDVDQYRPTIVAEANKRINGKLELGHLKLSLWGAIKINAESIKVSVNGYPNSLLETQDFHLEVPILSILSGRPRVVAVLDAPKIAVVKDASGKTNALELMKSADAPAAPEAASASAPAAPSAPVAASPAEAPKVPAILAGARLGLRIKEGNLVYQDQLTKSEYSVIGLDLNARDLGLGSTTTISVKAPLKGASPSMKFDGPVSLDAELTPNLGDNSVKSVSGKFDLDASKLQMEITGGTFKKTDAMPLKLHAQFEGNDKETLLRALELQFSTFRIHGKGRLTAEPLTAKLEMGTDPNTVHLDQVEKFVPMVAAYQLKGVADFNANVDWKPENLQVNGDFKVNDGSFFLKDTLKAPLQFVVQAGFSENSLNIARATISGPDTDMDMVGNVKNFLAPQFTLSLSGKSFNVDKVVNFPPPEAKKSAENILPALFGREAYADGKSADVNPMYSFAKNPIFANAVGTATAKLGKVVIYGAALEQVMARLQLQNMVLKVLDASLKTFGGTIKTTGEFDLKTPGLSYHSQGSVASLSGKEALKAYFPKYENTLEGIMDANWNVSGAVYPATVRIRSMKGGAKVAARDGLFKSVDFKDSINGITGKIPFLKNQKPVNISGRFKSFTGELKFNDGVIRAEPLEMHQAENGFVVKGKSTIQESLEQETFLDLFDPQGQLPKELQNPGRAAIAMRIYGPITSPKTDYEYTVKRLLNTAGKNVVQQEGIKILNKALGVNNGGENKGGDNLKKAADELRKKFGF